LWGPAVWAAPPEKRAAVVDVVTEGLAPAARDRLDDALVEGLRFTGYVVVPRRSVRETAAKANFPEGCAFGPCLAQVGRALDVGRALAARVVVDGQAYSFVLTLVALKNVDVPTARRGSGPAAGPWLTAAGVAACVVGAVLVAKTDQRDGGFVTIGAGSALLATGIFVWVLD
jgi:hypothetical protein